MEDIEEITTKLQSNYIVLKKLSFRIREDYSKISNEYNQIDISKNKKSITLRIKDFEKIYDETKKLLSLRGDDIEGETSSKIEVSLEHIEKEILPLIKSIKEKIGYSSLDVEIDENEKKDLFAEAKKEKEIKEQKERELIMKEYNQLKMIKENINNELKNQEINMKLIEKEENLKVEEKKIEKLETQENVKENKNNEKNECCNNLIDAICKYKLTIFVGIICFLLGILIGLLIK